MIDSFKQGPEEHAGGAGCMAVIVNPSSPDSVFSMQDIKDILTGRFNKNLIPVFDGVQATSTVRFIVDSVLRTDSLNSQYSRSQVKPGSYRLYCGSS